MAVVDSTRGGLLGSSAEEVLATLATQFRQRSAFVRELIQNSLDAGATHVSLNLDGRGEYLHIRLEDDGCGMDRRIIEEHLLVLFRSTKDADHTQIGGFGVGFVSLFALDPVAVVIDTARYGTHLRVVIDAKRHYTLVEVDEPFEGTAVELILALEPAAATTLA
ncbi:MAG: ATP-binding protein, partial [Nannocystaceae bacterium]